MAQEAMTIARGLADDALAADALAALNWFSFLQGDLSAALARADEAVALARAAGNPTRIAVALGHRAVFKAEAGDLDASLADYQEVLSLARASGDNYTLAVTLVNLGVDQVTAGEFPAALAYLQDALRVADAHGYQHLSAAAEMNLGFAYLLNGDAAAARRLLVGVLGRARATSETTWVHNALLGLALAAGVDAEPAVAATLHGAADHQYEQAGQAFDAKESKMRISDHARLRRHARGGRVRCRLPAWPHAQPGRCHRLCPEHSPSRSGAPGLRRRSRRPPRAGGQSSRPAVGARAGDHGAAGRRGEQRQDRADALRNAQYGADAPGPDQGQDRRPQPRRTDPLRDTGRHRASRPSPLM